MRRGVTAVVISAGLVALLWSPVQATTVRAVRTIRSADFTRIIVECSEHAEYRVTRAEGPEPRFAVDFPGASLPADGLPPISFDSGPAELVRAVRTETGVRLLIQTRDKASASTFPLLDPFRLVVDVGGEVSRAGGAGVGRAVPGPPPSERASSENKQGAVPRKPPAQIYAGRRPPPELRAPASRLKLMIDPGHGGHDPGARGVGDVWEKDVVLDIALRLADKAKKNGSFEVRMTRASDIFVPLEERTARANAFGADVFLSIHGNASENPELSGMETYYLNNTNDRATIRLAQMENGLASATGGGVRQGDVAFILSDLVQSYKVDESVDLAEALQKSAVHQARRLHSDLRDIGVKAGPFYVLVGAGMPAALVETSFLTNPQEGRALGQAAYREAIAEGLLQGLLRFLENRRDAETL